MLTEERIGACVLGLIFLWSLHRGHLNGTGWLKRKDEEMDGINFPRVIQKHTKLVNFLLLQHFASKLCNFTNFRTLFNAVVMNFTISRFLKILSTMQSIH